MVTLPDVADLRMECLCHLRRIIGASQRATGNEGFDVDLLKQRQVSGVIPPVMESCSPISDSAFILLRSASSHCWPLACASRPRWYIACFTPMRCHARASSSVQLPNSSIWISPPPRSATSWPRSTVASGAAQMMVIQFAPAPNACSASVSPASATFQSATIILSGHCARRARTAFSPSVRHRMVPASTMSTCSESVATSLRGLKRGVVERQLQ